MSWENEAFLAIKELGPDKFEIVVPSLSILAEPPVAVVDDVSTKRHAQGRRSVPGAISTRPKDRRSRRSISIARGSDVAAKYASQFPKIKLFTIDEVFGGWQKAAETHFADGGVFDQIYQPRGN